MVGLISEELGEAVGDHSQRVGVLLAGGTGTRLMPLTESVNKHLLPVYDKPMIFYPLSLLMLAGIRDVVLVSGPRDLPQISKLLGTGSRFGLTIQYVEQARPDGIAGALGLCRQHAKDKEVLLVLGDNILLGRDLGSSLSSVKLNGRAHIFTQMVDDPSPYAVVVRNETGEVAALVEKPAHTSSFEAVPGLYLYPDDVFDKVDAVRPSARGEREITDVNISYLREGRLVAQPLSRGSHWVDAGSVNQLHEVSAFVKLLQDRQGMLIGSPDEIAVRRGWLSADALEARLAELNGSDYGRALSRVVDELRLDPSPDSI